MPSAWDNPQFSPQWFPFPTPGQDRREGPVVFTEPCARVPLRMCSPTFHIIPGAQGRCTLVNSLLLLRKGGIHESKVLVLIHWGSVHNPQVTESNFDRAVSINWTVHQSIYLWGRVTLSHPEGQFVNCLCSGFKTLAIQNIALG